AQAVAIEYPHTIGFEVIRGHLQYGHRPAGRAYRNTQRPQADAGAPQAHLELVHGPRPAGQGADECDPAIRERAVVPGHTLRYIRRIDGIPLPVCDSLEIRSANINLAAARGILAPGARQRHGFFRIGYAETVPIGIVDAGRVP